MTGKDSFFWEIPPWGDEKQKNTFLLKYSKMFALIIYILGRYAYD